MIEELLIPSIESHHVQEFCKHLSPYEKASYISICAEPYAEKLYCFPNVKTKVQNNGGSSVFGWSIIERADIYLEAQFHCVWSSNEGKLVDITPSDAGLDKILFLPTPHLSYTGTPVQHHHYALGDPAKVQELLFLLNTLFASFNHFAQTGFNRNDPIFQKLEALRSKIEYLKKEIRSEKT